MGKYRRWRNGISAGRDQDAGRIKIQWMALLELWLISCLSNQSSLLPRHKKEAASVKPAKDSVAVLHDVPAPQFPMSNPTVLS